MANEAVLRDTARAAGLPTPSPTRQLDNLRAALALALGTIGAGTPSGTR